MIDLTHCQETINTFGGSEKKKRILYDHRIYMVKFPDPVRELHNSLSYMNNQFSEDIGCKIFKMEKRRLLLPARISRKTERN